MARLINKIGNRYGVWSNMLDKYIFQGTMNKCIRYEADECIENGKLEAIRCIMERKERGLYNKWYGELLDVSEDKWDDIINQKLEELYEELS